jgi:HAD superfamily phosphatase
MTAFPPGKTLLLDMDGVLAEVSKSYRASIIATCHEYGATSITFDTVAEWKARGGCNNDWKLSHDLINTDPNGKKDVTYEEVVETFEKYYQGEGDKPGLCDLETLIASKECLEELKKRCGAHGMAVVTGRPKSDCDKFLKLHKIDHLFDCCVCMEDGPPKPDPFPVVRALELLNQKPSKAVIMVGDTPDDIRAAIACGCRAIGVATPENVAKSTAEGKEHDSCALSVAMKECGADIVMKPGFEGLLDIFPKVD